MSWYTKSLSWSNEFLCKHPQSMCMLRFLRIMNKYQYSLLNSECLFATNKMLIFVRLNAGASIRRKEVRKICAFQMVPNLKRKHWLFWCVHAFGFIREKGKSWSSIYFQLTTAADARRVNIVFFCAVQSTNAIQCRWWLFIDARFLAHSSDDPFDNRINQDVRCLFAQCWPVCSWPNHVSIFDVQTGDKLISIQFAANKQMWFFAC